MIPAMRRSFLLALGPVVAVVAIAAPTTVSANAGGRPGGGCVGCHAGGDVSMSLSASPSSFGPGEQVTVTVTVSGNGATAGLFVDADAGDLSTLGGQGLEEVAAGLTHSQPKAMSGGETEFSFRWTAPDDAGSVRFALSVLVANGNGSASGDKADSANFDLVFGCEGASYFLDFDADGYGRTDAPRTDCAGAAPAMHAAASGDCDDTRDTVHPGATELCNQRDDDCDTEIDEDAIPIPLYPDGDEDGYYGQLEAMSPDVVMGCVGTPDYAGEPGDCEPDDPSMHPGAEEICNLYDDNCDGRADERVRPICGVGWCAREAWTCEVENCDPGEPQEETCNLLDDDCDDEIDEDVACPEGQACIAGECRVAGSDGGSEGAVGSDGGEVGTGVDPAGTGSGGPAESEGAAGCACAATRGASSPAAWSWIVLFAARRRRRVRST